ncbi:histidine kinase [Nonomuraea sp. NPDC049269]|uniref:sensor histidine kinase n=1 Tax=Nonomuraea sp. NPDC049269 TaxID=3364349 RepID=UPI0037117063
MSVQEPSRRPMVAPVGVFAAAASLQVALSVSAGLDDRLGELAVTLTALAVPVLIGCLVGWRAPQVPVGAALAWVGAAPAAVFALGMWGESALTPHPWPGAGVVYVVQLGAWVWNLAGFAALCLVFPSGMLPGRWWRRVAWGAVATGVLAHAAISWLRTDDGHAWLVGLPGPAQTAVTVLLFGVLLAVLAAVLSSLFVRYRRGDEMTRLQLRWPLLGAATVPVLLGGGWVAEAYGAPVIVAYTGFLLAMLVAIPAAVAVAVLRHELFDVDRLLGSSLAWLLTSLLSAAVFAAIVYSVAEAVGAAASGLGTTAAAFVTALVLLPLHRRVNALVGRITDRERYLVDARVQRFVAQVRDGTAEPEGVLDVLREALADPRLQFLIRLPNSGPGEYVDLADVSAVPMPGGARVPLRTGDTEVGMIVLGTSSLRRLRLAKDVSRQARLPIEVTRLRLEVRTALEEVRQSRARLAVAAVEERRQLERDLHDGAQQHIVAAGMRLRSLQRRLPATAGEHADLDAVVETLEGAIAELRRLAHGIRPNRLDDGLAAALQTLVADAPIPVRLTVADVAVPEVLATTLYFVVAEAYANALKHAKASTVSIDVAETAEGTLRVQVADDGIGGATEPTSARDRVASVGGEIHVHSPHGGGTRLEVVIADAHRGGR